MTTIEAMKQFICFIKDDGTTIDDISETNVTQLWNLIGIWFAQRFNITVEILTVTSVPGTTEGTTKITVSPTESGVSYRYIWNNRTDLITLPASLDDLSSWTEWDGISDITAEDGAKICVARVNATNNPIKAGITTINANLG